MRWRIAAPSLLLLLVSLATLGLALGAQLRESQQRQLLEQLRREAQLTALDLAPLVGTPGEVLADRARQLVGSEARELLVYAPSGTLLASAGPGVAPQATPPVVLQALGSDGAEATIAGPGHGAAWPALALPLYQGKRIVGVVVLAAPPASEQGGLTQAILILVAAMLVAGVAMLMVSDWQLKTLLDPLREVALLAHWLGQGDLEHRVYLGERGSLREVADALNEMSARLQAQVTTLSEERSRLSAILATMADGVIIADASGTVVLINAAAQRSLRVPHGRGVGSSFVQVVRDHELALELRRVLDGQIRETSARVIQVGSPPRSLRTRVTPLVSPSGRQALVVLQDVTDLRQAELIRQEFIANVSHELRTPLATLLALVETLEGGALDDEEAAHDFLEKMHGEVDRLIRLVSEQLELSRIESGQAPMRLEPTDPRTLLSDVAERLQPQAARTDLSLRVELSDELPLVLADAERVEQVLINLIHNAIKFTPPGGSIVVSAAPDSAPPEGERAVRVSVADTGVGMPAEDLERVFQRFYKTDKARSGTGTGLGLAIAKHIIQAHGGRIWAESNLGQGATFSFTLPEAAAEQLAPLRASA